MRTARWQRRAGNGVYVGNVAQGDEAAGAALRTAGQVAAAGTVLGQRDLNRALLARQLLLERAEVTPAEALRHLVGMQAQVPQAPYVGLWSRLAAFAPEQLSTLLAERRAVRLVMMRSTLHLVTAEDCRALRPLLQPALERSLAGNFGRRLVDLDLEEVVAEGRRILAEDPCTLGELGERLAQRWPARDALALASVVRSREALVQPPPRGLWRGSGRAVHTTADAWLDEEPARPASLAELVERYLAAFGPASVQDLQAWSGLTRLRSVVDELGERLVHFTDEKGRTLHDLPEAPHPDPGTEAPVRFLPELDNLCLAHADRDRVLAEEHRKRLFTRNGILKPTFLLDGFVAGGWELVTPRAKAKGPTELVVTPFVGLTAQQRTALEEEGSRLLDLLAQQATERTVRVDAAR